MFWSKNVILGFWVWTSFVLGRTYRTRKGRFGVTFESFGDETSSVFESHFLAFIQGVFPKIISRSVDITACVPRREPLYSSPHLPTQITMCHVLFSLLFSLRPKIFCGIFWVSSEDTTRDPRITTKIKLKRDLIKIKNFVYVTIKINWFFDSLFFEIWAFKIRNPRFRAIWPCGTLKKDTLQYAESLRLSEDYVFNS